MASDVQQRTDEEVEAVELRRPHAESDEIDMTPMIDCVFLLLIFFLVNAATPRLDSQVELPPARYGAAADAKSAIVVTVLKGRGGPPEVYLGEGTSGERLPDDPAVRESRLLAAIEQGRGEGMDSVMVKAERTVRHRDVSKIAEAVGQVDGMKLYLAVFDGD